MRHPVAERPRLSPPNKVGGWACGDARKPSLALLRSLSRDAMAIRPETAADRDSLVPPGEHRTRPLGPE
eukprot:8397300-Alexandrium_andersonii.AAC.1